MRLKDLLLIDLIIGLLTSFKHIFKKKFTVSYPYKKLTPSKRFRGFFYLDPSTCIGCNMCWKACPIDIIYIKTHDEQTPEGKRKKVVDRFDINIQRCMFCGLCESACPNGSFKLTLRTGFYEGAVYDRKELYFDREKLKNYVQEKKGEKK